MCHNYRNIHLQGGGGWPLLLPFLQESKHGTGVSWGLSDGKSTSEVWYLLVSKDIAKRRPETLVDATHPWIATSCLMANLEWNEAHPVWPRDRGNGSFIKMWVLWNIKQKKTRILHLHHLLVGSLMGRPGICLWSCLSRCRCCWGHPRQQADWWAHCRWLVTGRL